MVARAILYHPVLQYISHLIFSFKNINTPLEFRYKNTEKIRGYMKKNAHILATESSREVSNDC